MTASFTGSGINGNPSNNIGIPALVEPLPSQEVELVETLDTMLLGFLWNT
ncbi:MAG: hypothetical protein RLZZ176_2414 [Cyanobacteriota bacterium]